MSNVWVMANPSPRINPPPSKNAFSPKGEFFYGHMHNQRDSLDMAGYKTAHAHNGFSVRNPHMKRADEEKFRAIAYQQYKTPHHRAKYRADAKLDREGHFDSEVHWKSNLEPGSRGHPKGDGSTYGKASNAAHTKAEINRRGEHADTRQEWLLKHNREPLVKTTWEKAEHDPTLPWMASDAQTQWYAKHSAQKGYLHPNGHIPVEPYEKEEDSQEKEYVPTEADLAVQPEDYDMTDAQLAFEIKKAKENEDELRLAALKIVRALREGDQPEKKKKPYARGTMKFVNDWLDA